jgi:ribosomal protein L40E
MSAYTATWVCPDCHARNAPSEVACERCGVEIAPGGPDDE